MADVWFEVTKKLGHRLAEGNQEARFHGTVKRVKPSQMFDGSAT
jgi:hypothetical protein